MRSDVAHFPGSIVCPNGHGLAVTDEAMLFAAAETAEPIRLERRRLSPAAVRCPSLQNVGQNNVRWRVGCAEEDFVERHPATVGRPELSRLLRVSPTTLDRMRVNGNFPVKPLDWPGHPRWSRAAVAQWLSGDPDLGDEDFALLTLAEVAELLGIARATAYRRLPFGRLQSAAVQVNRERRYPRAALALMLTGGPVGAATYP